MGMIIRRCDTSTQEWFYLLGAESKLPDTYEKFEDDWILKLPWKSLQNKVNFFFLGGKVY